MLWSTSDSPIREAAMMSIVQDAIGLLDPTRTKVPTAGESTPNGSSK
ncbi:uncharacterized protein G2W53_026653 [Senna tora]|uniref:Uncharacterized protein n=1 Tax=Senna tora TaxID=362788 RepID=A0A834TFF6_9FABA|nr:uncharacterized protein G2W53_026653 [Senna tora]